MGQRRRARPTHPSAEDEVMSNEPRPTRAGVAPTTKLPSGGEGLRFPLRNRARRPDGLQRTRRPPDTSASRNPLCPTQPNSPSPSTPSPSPASRCNPTPARVADSSQGVAARRPLVAAHKQRTTPAGVAQPDRGLGRREPPGEKPDSVRTAGLRQRTRPELLRAGPDSATPPGSGVLSAPQPGVPTSRDALATFDDPYRGRAPKAKPRALDIKEPPGPTRLNIPSSSPA